MKRQITVAVCLLTVGLACMLSGCSGSTDMEALLSSTAETAASTEAATTTTTTMASAEASPYETEGVDIDLTVLSDTMAYSQVYAMMSAPEEYMGKTIRLRGPYYFSYNSALKTRYYFVAVSDATACCQQGMEFIWDDNTHVFPDEYPSTDDIIEITGQFGTYEEEENSYYYLAVTELKQLSDTE